MKKGEIWILNLPFGDGREQSGIRPCLVMGDTKVGMILTIPLTSSIQALRFPYTLEIKKSQKNGLDKDSIAMIFQIQSLDRKRFVKKIGELEEVKLNEVNGMLRSLLNL